MALWHRHRQSVAVVAVVVAAGIIGSAVYLGTPEQPASRPADATLSTVVARELRHPVSVHVINRIEQNPCAAGAGGVPGPGSGGDWCYFLDPGLTLTRADRVELVPEMSGQYSVAVTLASADRDTFAGWTAQAAGRQIAIGLQGRVVQAPELLEPLSGESLYISSFAEAESRALVQQLWQ